MGTSLASTVTNGACIAALFSGATSFLQEIQTDEKTTKSSDRERKEVGFISEIDFSKFQLK